MKTVVYSTEDADTIRCATPTRPVCIKACQSNKSYLVMAPIIAGVKNTGAEAIHPGYRVFGRERGVRPRLRRQRPGVHRPRPECIDRMGDKSSARETMKRLRAHGARFRRLLDTVEEAAAFAEKVSYPVLIKATAGGGGKKGMREVHDPADLAAQYKAARTEAGAAFGNDGVYLEKLVLRPRHVEVQVLADDSATLWPSASATAPSSGVIRSFWKRPPRRRFPRTCAAT